jgi:hypothetical protein
MESDPVRALLGLLFLLFLGYAIIGRIWLLGRMKAHIPGLSLFLSTTFFYLESKYWKNREKLNREGLRIKALLVFLSPLAVLAVFLAMFLTRN